MKIEINAIICGLIPSFQSIDNHTMSDINNITEAQKRDVEQKLALISANPLKLLIKEREAHEAKMADIDAKLRTLCREIGVELGVTGNGAGGGGWSCCLKIARRRRHPASPRFSGRNPIHPTYLFVETAQSRGDYGYDSFHVKTVEQI